MTVSLPAVGREHLWTPARVHKCQPDSEGVLFVCRAQAASDTEA